jgi:hypothetical protein
MMIIKCLSPAQSLGIPLPKCLHTPAFLLSSSEVRAARVPTSTYKSSYHTSSDYLASPCVPLSRVHLAKKKGESYLATRKSTIFIAEGKCNQHDLLPAYSNSQAEERRPIKMLDDLSDTTAAVGRAAQSSSTPAIFALVTLKTLPTAFITSTTLASNTDLSS